MAFELLEKKSGVQGIPSNQLSVSKTSISFGRDFLNTLEVGGGYVEVYLDRINNRIGFNPVGKITSGYRVQLDKGSSGRAYLSSPKVSKMIPSGRYVGHIDSNGFITISVERIINKENSKKVELIKN